MRDQFYQLFMRSAALVGVSALAIASCEIEGLTDALEPTCSQAERPFRCVSPTIAVHNQCGSNCQCVGDATKPVSSTWPVAYLCVQSGGQFASVGLFPSLEDLNAALAGNNIRGPINCVSKVRCTNDRL